LAGLRLLIVADSSTTHTHRWAQWFRDRAAVVTVLSPFDDPIEGVRVEKFPSRARWYHRIPKLRNLPDLPAFKRLINNINPQLIHFHFVSEGGRAFYWDRVDVPMVASSWGQDVIFDSGPQPKTEKSLRRILGKVKLITATTHMLAGATMPFVPHNKPIYVVPFGVDLFRFSVRPESTSDGCVIGFVKHLLPKYGPNILIEAFAKVHQARPLTRLVIAGRGSMRNQLERQVAELGLGGAVEILGRVPHEAVPALIATFDIMVMPSIYESETFGVAAVEAAASGVPVVASRVGGVPEAVLHGQTGLLVSPRNVNELAQACISMIDDPRLRRRMGLCGRRFVERYYAWHDNARSMEEIYRAALTGDQPHGVPVYVPGRLPDLQIS
jgi:L-malate glycosyltransferase